MNRLPSSVVDSFNKAEPGQRLVLYRSKGRRQGPVRRLASPTGIGERIKPFVLLDDLDALSTCEPVFAMHPYSGQAGLTVVLSGVVDYKDTAGKYGTLAAGGVGWMLAGGGAGHEGRAVESGRVRAVHLRIALPPEDENGPVSSRYLAPEEVSQEGPARVILGRHGQASSIIATRTGMNLLQIKLKHGTRWRYQPPPGHTVGWVYAYTGKLHTRGAELSSELAVYEESDAAMEFQAEGDTEFFLGSAAKHDHELVLGNSSVHTNRHALRQAEVELEHVGSRLWEWRRA